MQAPTAAASSLRRNRTVFIGLSSCCGLNASNPWSRPNFAARRGRQLYTAALRGSLRGQLSRPPVGPHGNIGEACFGDLDANHLAGVALRVHLDVHGDRCAPDLDDLRIKAYNIADQNGLLE